MRDRPTVLGYALLLLVSAIVGAVLVTDLSVPPQYGFILFLVLALGFAFVYERSHME
ncbi:MAG: hypothetical protein ACOCY7_00370 [Halodesulfurarchaeum sp.]